jgi:uncharacterized membrane protein
MKKLILLMSVLSLAVGCNNTTTSSVGTKTSTRTGEPVVKKLTLTAAKDQTINRGATEKVGISISRSNFDDPVMISVSDLPKGIEVVEKDLLMATGSTSITITLKAAADAAPGEHNVTLSASAPGMDATTQTFKLTVK